MRQNCFKWQDMVLAYDRDEDEYTVTVRGEEISLDDPGNPMEAWEVFIARVDHEMKMRIGAACEAKGRDRRTGEKKA